MNTLNTSGALHRQAGLKQLKRCPRLNQAFSPSPHLQKESSPPKSKKTWQKFSFVTASAPTTKTMVALRLTRQGSKDRPYYKIVAVDSRKRRDGRYIEQLGTYNPMADGENYTLDLEKADKWLGVGAKPSGTVASIIKKVRKAS